MKSGLAFTKDYGKAIAQGVIAIILAGTALITYWVNEPPPYRSYSRLVLTPIVEPGEHFRLAVKVYWTKSCYSKLYRNMIDGAGKITPYEREVRPNKQGWAEFEITAMVPIDATPGEGVWDVRTDWYCNPVQRKYPYVDQLEPVHFKIVPTGSKKFTRR